MEKLKIEKTDSITFDRETATLSIQLQNFDGARLRGMQKAVLLGIEEIGCCERSDSDDYRNAIADLSLLSRALMLDDSQTNVGLGGKPYSLKNSPD